MLLLEGGCEAVWRELFPICDTESLEDVRLEPGDCTALQTWQAFLSQTTTQKGMERRAAVMP